MAEGKKRAKASRGGQKDREKVSESQRCGSVRWGVQQMGNSGFVLDPELAVDSADVMAHRIGRQAQVAGDFATLVSPPTLGSVAINMRFLTKAGLHPALAGASVGVLFSQFASNRVDSGIKK